ncbi:hypothetical protein FRC01_007294, partial [Tulasnella sp. 417]
MTCSDDAGEVACQMTCGKVMACCGGVCKDLCGNCQAVNVPGFLTKHTDHKSEIMIVPMFLARISVARVADTKDATSPALSLVSHVWTRVIGFANIK